MLVVKILTTQNIYYFTEIISKNNITKYALVSQVS